MWSVFQVPVDLLDKPVNKLVFLSLGTSQLFYNYPQDAKNSFFPGRQKA